MLNNPASDRHQTTRLETTALFGQAKFLLDVRPKAITPFGGLASWLAFHGQIGYPQVERRLPFPAPTSNKSIRLAHVLTAFLWSVVAGARRFARCQWLRTDRVVQALLGSNISE